MIRIAILGGGISGLTAAYELELARRRGIAIDWRLYEATGRLGGIVETTHHTTPGGDFILEGGPDAWVTEKPWASDLAIELGLEDQLIHSNDATRKTYILMPNPGTAGKLQPIPDRMRLMVPADLSTLEASSLFSPAARAAYAAELANAAPLRAAAAEREANGKPDESVAAFVLRHFGPEVLATLAAPLLSGVFGGDAHKLSARAVMPQFVAMEREHGSLIAALQAQSTQRTQPPQPIFTSLRNGMGSLIDALIGQLPPDRLHLQRAAKSLKRERNLWCLRTATTTPAHSARVSKKHFNRILLATPLDVTHRLLQPIDTAAAALLPTHASSAVLATLGWPSGLARGFTIPPGFGFLVPPQTRSSRPERSVAQTRAVHAAGSSEGRELLACTFVDQKFPHRCPPGARVLRAFFGGPGAESLSTQSDEAAAALALTQLRAILGPIPEPSFTTIRRWPRSLPQYEVGHLGRMAELEKLIARTPGLHLLGNSYRGVGLSDLIRDARATARAILSRLGSRASHQQG